jgi:hypothetical protein
MYISHVMSSSMRQDSGTWVLAEVADADDAPRTPVASPEGAPGSPRGSLVNQGHDADEDQQNSPISADRLDTDHDDAPLRLRLMRSIVGQAVVPGFAARNIE